MLKTKRLLVVSDASSLILAAKLDLLKYLEDIFNIIIPRVVFEEVVIKGKELKKEDAFKIELYIKNSKINVLDVNEIKNVKDLGNELNLGKGELGSIYLYIKKNADLLLIDDKQAIKASKILNIRWTNMANILLLLLILNKIGYEKALNILNDLEKFGRYKISYILDLKNKIEEIKGSKKW